MRKILIAILFSIILSFAYPQNVGNTIDKTVKRIDKYELFAENITNESDNIPANFLNETEPKETLTFNAGNSQLIKPQYSQNKSFRGNGEIAYQKGIGEFGTDRLKVNASALFQIESFLYAGIGAGARQYPDYKSTLIPIFVDVKGILLKSKFSPILGVQLGTTFNASDKFKSVGLMASPEIGLSVKFSERAFTYFSIGYEFQKMTFVNFITLDYIGYVKDNNGAISFNLGFMF